MQPQPDWWFQGGRIFPGETPIQSCQRLLKRELGLDIEKSRFRPVCCQAFAFEMREQEPKNHGTTDVQFCLRLQLQSEDEVKKVVLDEKEYCDSKWVDPSEILEGNYHPALRFAVANMIATDAFVALDECEGRGGDDAEIAKLTKDFLSKTRKAKRVLERKDYKLHSNELNYETTVKTDF